MTPDQRIRIEWTPDGFVLDGIDYSQPRRLAPTLDDVIDILRWYYSNLDERFDLEKSYVAHTDKGLFDARRAATPEG